MEIKQVFANTKEAIDFLLMPWRLYPANERMESTAEIEALLAGTHVLSPTFSFQAYIAYVDQEAVIRSALIYNRTNNESYLGFFEAVNLPQVMEKFMDFIFEQARSLGAKKLIGPVNGSFWLGYRMKLSNFDCAPFTGEPHNLDYYPDLWQTIGFELVEQYQSHFYTQSPLGFQAERLKKRYRHFIDRGYQFVHPKKDDWSKVSLEVFYLLKNLYADFPVFQSITDSQFSEIFAAYKQILDFSMVTLAYYESKLVGFFIPLPDYGTIVYQKLTPLNIFKILTRRKKAKRYILLYLGVDADHLGLGSALSYIVFKNIKKRKALSIGALIHQGKITNHYVKELQTAHTDYGLFEIKL